MTALVVACRNLDRARSARADVRASVGDPSLSILELDLADLSSVRSFVDAFTEDHGELHVLCDNAGIMASARRETRDGFEMEFEDLQSEDEYDKWDAYGQSKLANLLFAYELDRRLRDAGASVTSIGCHPGYAATGLQQRGPEMAGSRLRLWGMKIANRVVAQSAEREALPMLYAATAPDIAGGEYVGPGGFMNMRGAPAIQESSDRSREEEPAARLWDVSEDLTGVGFDLDADGG